MADELMRELAPLLAEDGIDLDDPSTIPDIEALQLAINRAIERRNLAMFTPVGRAREVALITLRLYTEAIATDQTDLAAAILATAQPESPDNSVATVAATIGVALDLLDEILSGHHADAPTRIASLTDLPAGHWVGERAARDILSLAQRGRASGASRSLIARQGGHAVQAGAALALAATMQAWSTAVGGPVDRLTPTVFR